MEIVVKIDTRSSQVYVQLERLIHTIRAAGISDSEIADALALLTAEVALKGFSGFEGPDDVINEWARCAYAIASEPKWGQR